MKMTAEMETGMMKEFLAN